MNIAKRYEMVPLSNIVPYARNPRKHDEKQIAQIRASFREYGVLSPCVVDENYNLLVGHGRLLAAREEGLPEINCIIAEGLTPAQKKGFVITDNKLTENSEWIPDLLSLEFTELKDMGFDVELTGFSLDEIEKLFSTDETVDDDDFDADSALKEPPIALLGDIWNLGKHRLIVGDSTDKATIDRLMNGKLANLIVTDPPYNVAYDKGKAGTIKNDNLENNEFYQFLLVAFQNMHNSLTKDGAIYVFHADTEGLNFRLAFHNAGFKLSGCCIWKKNSLVLGRSDYQWIHEPVLYGWRADGTHKWYSDRKQTTLWAFDRPTKSDLHPTMKPIPLLAYPIQNSSSANSIVLDPFGGSGSTLICCEKLDRTCYICELDEKYASASILRYIQSYGAENITIERAGKVLQYADLVKEVEKS
jgi:DNA modification methylase